MLRTWVLTTCKVFIIMIKIEKQCLMDKLVTVITGNCILSAKISNQIQPKLNNDKIESGFLIKLFWFFKL